LPPGFGVPQLHSRTDRGALLIRQVQTVAAPILTLGIGNPGVLAVREQFQILNAIVSLIAVEVVNIFMRLQGAPEVLLHHQPMLTHAATIHANGTVTPLVDPALAGACVPWPCAFRSGH
jgi:hypothetical protein